MKDAIAMKCNPHSDQLIRIMSDDGSLRATVASTTNLVGEICKRQKTDPTASVALGRLVTAAALMSSLLKGNQRVALSIEGNGPLQKLQAESDAAGTVRGTIKQPCCNLPPVNNRFDVANAIGKAGFLQVVKDLGLKEPYRGMVQLTTSEVAEDLAHYFTTSEQTPTSIALGVTLDHDAGIAASGGFLVQALPDCDESLLEQLEQTVANFAAVSTQLHQGSTPLDILKKLMINIPFTIQAEYPLNFSCHCSQEHVINMLKGIPTEDILELSERHENTEIVCEYCKKTYCFTPIEIKNIIS